MDFLSSKRFVSVILTALLLLNIALLGALWWQNFYTPANHPVEADKKNYTSKRSFFQKELNLTDDQSRKFNALRKDHFNGSIPVFIQIAALKKQLIRESVREKPDVEIINDLSDRIGRHQAILERRLAWHFHSLSLVCTPEQRDSLQKMLENVTFKARIKSRTIVRKDMNVNEKTPDSLMQSQQQ
ncbi:MAG: periplasmic heavy metal sensor [Prosthecochloris sp.]|uniref:Periplasmic heavy metal sensor n=1 Tax=Prosthecochloris aestuarii (strain DSM 271 / SK 413) TaxID=290512 RepID=B4S4W6_PROA2|nr:MULTISPECIES: periplasmic heavy metal sensor [Prosthecochloris]ACF45464.1 conserved hypothetical protein [Prosthecochloris aestuarii DSM 271]MCW8798271.1 periplasmic heavy metal sensor [Prosthecochloris sp.]RDD31010.1 hypothetical protein CR161_10040 [Prosthecochloris sp. ZM]